MKILLLGGNFKNKGAEAMILTAVKQLGQRFLGAEFFVASYAKSDNLPYGRQSIGDVNFNFIKNPRSLAKPLRLALYKIFGSKKFICGDQYLRHFSEADLVIDISGFAMTDQRPLVRRIVYCFEIATAKIFRKQFVCFTQAMGPFNNSATKLLGQMFLPAVSLIVARGESTLRYLKQLGVDRRVEIVRCSDSAYLFEVREGVDTTDILNPALVGQGKLFGIVPNINIYSRTYPHDENNPYIVLLSELSSFVIDKLGAKVVFVCHEQYADKKDDEWLVTQVKKRIGDTDDLLFISAKESAERLKSVIGSLDFVVASRFHSVVAAISKKVPFLSLGWSHKYKELVDETGLSQCVLDGRELSAAQLIARVEQLWAEKEVIKQQLDVEAPKRKLSAAQAFDKVAQLYGATRI